MFVHLPTAQSGIILQRANLRLSEASCVSG
jgi:hypothetical protein